MRARSTVALSSVLALVLGGVVSTPAHADTFTATTEAELITAINAANSTPGADLIELSGAGFTITGVLPGITETVEIRGPGSATFTIDAEGFDLFESMGSASNTQLTLSGMTVEDGGSYSVRTTDLDVVLSDVVVDALIDHSTGDFSATDVEVTGADFTAGMIINADGSDIVTLLRVRVTQTFETGIRIVANDDAEVTLTFVDVIESALDFREGLSLELNGTSGATVSDSEFSRNFGDGINVRVLDNAAVVIERVTADGNEDSDGIDVDTESGATATVRESSAADNGDSGFESVINGGTTSTFTNVTANGNVDNGFDIEADQGAQVAITNPVALNNDDDGVMVEPDTADAVITVVGGRGVGNGGHGFSFNIDEGTATSTGFLARDNGEGGVLVDGFNGQATLRNATVVDNNEVDLTAGGGVDIAAYEDDDDNIDGPLDVIIEGTTISSNMSGLFGGGISGTVDDGSTVTIRNSTISGNEAPNAGAITLESTDNSELTIEHSTIAQNETTNANQEAVLPAGMTVTITHSIIAGNLGPGPEVDLGEDTSTLDIDYSLVQTADANSLVALAAGTGNIVGEPTGLGPLANNGGPTLTHLPLAGSAAMSAGNAAIVGAPSTDQRGDDRIVGVIEIGAVEVQDPELAATGATNGFAGGAAGLALLLLVSGALLMVLRRNARESIAR
jgi:hypothetical protein